MKGKLKGNFHNLLVQKLYISNFLIRLVDLKEFTVRTLGCKDIGIQKSEFVGKDSIPYMLFILLDYRIVWIRYIFVNKTGRCSFNVICKLYLCTLYRKM